MVPLCLLTMCSWPSPSPRPSPSPSPRPSLLPLLLPLLLAPWHWVQAGKLSDETVLELIAELELTETLMDGHAQEYSNHAVALRQTLKALRRNARLFAADVCGDAGGMA